MTTQAGWLSSFYEVPTKELQTLQEKNQRTEVSRRFELIFRLKNISVHFCLKLLTTD